MIINYFGFILVASILLALTEIQTEGNFGWAKNLPTWRKKINVGVTSFELTGYHLFFFTFVFLLMHLNYADVLGTNSCERY